MYFSVLSGRSWTFEDVVPTICVDSVLCLSWVGGVRDGLVSRTGCSSFTG